MQGVDQKAKAFVLFGAICVGMLIAVLQAG
jgi:hypothetical protein